MGKVNKNRVAEALKTSDVHYVREVGSYLANTKELLNKINYYLMEFDGVLSIRGMRSRNASKRAIAAAKATQSFEALLQLKKQFDAAFNEIANAATNPQLEVDARSSRSLAVKMFEEARGNKHDGTFPPNRTYQSCEEVYAAGSSDEMYLILARQWAQYHYEVEMGIITDQEDNNGDDNSNRK